MSGVICTWWRLSRTTATTTATDTDNNAGRLLYPSSSNNSGLSLVSLQLHYFRTSQIDDFVPIKRQFVLQGKRAVPRILYSNM